MGSSGRVLLVGFKGNRVVWGSMTSVALDQDRGSSYISRVESGQTEPKVSTFYRIMNALGCKIEFSMIL